MADDGTCFSMERVINFFPSVRNVVDALVKRSIDAAAFGCVLIEKASKGGYQEETDCWIPAERRYGTEIYGEMLRGLENCSDKDYVKGQVEKFIKGKQNPSKFPGDGCPGAWWNEKETVKQVTQKKSKAIADFIRTNFPDFDYVVIVYQGHHTTDNFRGCIKCPDIMIDG